MKTLLFSPHGFVRQEVGLALAVLGYLRPQMTSLTQLTCQGLFRQCGRDPSEGKRTLSQCFQCQDEQLTVADWLAAEPVDLASYLSPEDIRASSEYVAQVEEGALENFTLHNVPLSLILRNSPHRSKLKVIGQRADRQELLDALRFFNAAEQMLLELSPDVIFATGLEDYMNVLLEGIARRMRIQMLRFRSHVGEQQSEMIDTRTGKRVVSELLLRHAGFIPKHNEDWPEGLRSHVESLLLQLDLLDPQLSLQLTAVGS